MPTAGFALWSLGVSISHSPSPPRDQPFLIWVVDHPWLSAAIVGLTALVAVISTSFYYPLLPWGGLLSINVLALALMIVALDNGNSGVWFVLPFVGLFLCSTASVLLF